MLGTFVVGGLWAASAVYVAGWAWRALSATYTTFPDQGQTSAAGGINTRAEGQKIGQNALSKIPVVGSALASASQALGSITGTEANLNSKQIARLQKLPAPPTRIVSQLKRAVGPTMNPDTVGSANAAAGTRALQEFVQWAGAHGYARSDMGAYLTLIFPHSTWPNLH